MNYSNLIINWRHLTNYNIYDKCETKDLKIIKIIINITI